MEEMHKQLEDGSVTELLKIEDVECAPKRANKVDSFLVQRGNSQALLYCCLHLGGRDGKPSLIVVYF